MGQYSDSFYSEGSAIMESETIYNAQIEERHTTPGKTPLKLLTSQSRTRRIFAKDITAKKEKNQTLIGNFDQEIGEIVQIDSCSSMCIVIMQQAFIIW